MGMAPESGGTWIDLAAHIDYSVGNDIRGIMVTDMSVEFGILRYQLVLVTHKAFWFGTAPGTEERSFLINTDVSNLPAAMLDRSFLSLQIFQDCLFLANP